MSLIRPEKDRMSLVRPELNRMLLVRPERAAYPNPGQRPGNGERVINAPGKVKRYEKSVIFAP